MRDKSTATEGGVMDARYWLLDVMAGEDTSQDNRINEAGAAIGYPVVGLVDEDGGGVIGYLHADYAERIAERLNA